VNTFGRFSELLHMNLDSLHMSFSSVLQLLTNATRLRHEFGVVISDALGLRTLYLLFNKLVSYIKRMFHYLLFGATASDLEYAFKKTDSEMKRDKTRRSWWNTFLLVGGALWILRMLLVRIARHEQPQLTAEQMAQMSGHPAHPQMPPSMQGPHMPMHEGNPFPDYPPPSPYDSFPGF